MGRRLDGGFELWSLKDFHFGDPFGFISTEKLEEAVFCEKKVIGAKNTPARGK